MEQKNLNGTYKISFELDIDPTDQLSLSDVAQILTDGIGEPIIGKIAHLSIDKITKTSNKQASLKIGDKVRIKKDVQANVNIYSDDGYVFIGAPTDISGLVGENVPVTVSAGSYGFINKIGSDNTIEVANLDSTIDTYNDIGIDSINVDLISLEASALEKIENGEVK